MAIATVATMLAAAPAAGAAIPRESTQMIDRVNSVRSSHGLPPFEASEPLTGSARSYARYMLRHDYLGHQALIQAPGGFNLLGETLAWHFDWKPRVGMTLRGWMASAPHRAILLNPAFSQIGVGRAKGRYGAARTTAWVAQLGG